jgi:protein-disulfide isomerase
MIDQPQGEKPALTGEKPALTVVIQSWWTPALAVIMLVVGLLVGYFGRPLINQSSDNGGSAQSTEQVAAGNSAVAATPTVDPAQIQQIMDSIVKQTTNFQGDPTATVTLIEFSDYQ